MEMAGRDAADSRTAQQVVALESIVMEVLQRVDTKLAQQDEVLQALNVPKPPCKISEFETGTWAEVTKKNRRPRSEKMKTWPPAGPGEPEAGA